MKFETIVTDCALSIYQHQHFALAQHVTLPITFTHERKEAVGCVIFDLPAKGQGDYSVHRFEQRYGMVQDPVRKVPHSTLYDCETDWDQADELVTAIEKQVAILEAAQKK